MFINKKCNLENNEATCNGLLLRNLETQQIIENKIDFFVRLKIWLPIEVRQPGRCLALLWAAVNESLEFLPKYADCLVVTCQSNNSPTEYS